MERAAAVLEFRLGWVEGFEPSATGTTIRRSTKLSYTHREGLLDFTRTSRNCKIRTVPGWISLPRGSVGRLLVLLHVHRCGILLDRGLIIELAVGLHLHLLDLH